jgi:non-specific protein-tyrosine kinase
MELRSYFSILQRRKWLILAGLILGTVLATAFSLLSQPQYVASTTVRVLTVGGGTLTTARPDINYTERLVSTYSNIITSNTVRRQIMNQLGLEEFPTISVQTIPGTELIRIIAEAPDPEDARDIANTAAQILVDQNIEFYSGSAGETLQQILSEQLTAAEVELNQARADYAEALAASPPNDAAVAIASQLLNVRESTYASLLNQYEAARLEEAVRSNAISIIEEASAPNRPAKPRHPINIALGIAVGLSVGIALAFLLDNLDTKLYTTEQIENATQMTTLGEVPMAKDPLGIAKVTSGQYPQMESFRRLRTQILASASDGPQVMLLTSAKRGEGKSTVSSNLAVTISQSGREVVLVDCDLRLPTIHTLFDVTNKRGLTNILAGELMLEEAIQDSPFPRLQIIASGPLPPNPTELLGSQRMLDLIEQLKETFDFVILDSPALLSVADSAVLAPAVDKIIVVVAQAQTTRSDVQAVHQQLSNLNVKSMEVVINRAEPNGSYSYYESEPGRG